MFLTDTEDKTSKPLGLINDLLAITSRDAIVLDPSLGPGTTFVAAFQTGRKCIGIKQPVAYAEIARRRVAAVEI